MAKVTLYDLASGSFTVDLLNANFALVEAAFEKVLFRDGTAPNMMEASLDMNSYRIINLPNAASSGEPVTLGQLTALSTLNLYTPENHVHDYTTQLTNLPTEYPPEAHTHPQSDIVGLVSDLSAIDTRIDTLEARPVVYVQSGAPTSPNTNDIWLY